MNKIYISISWFELFYKKIDKQLYRKRWCRDEIYDVDLLEMLIEAAETGTEVLGVDYPNAKACKLWGIPIPK